MTFITMIPTRDLQRDAGEEPGFGALSCSRGNLPLKQMSIEASIRGLAATTVLRQTFVNVHAEPLEATYIFPLPDRAGVSAFRLEVGERVVEGVLEERGQARRNYDAAIQRGHRAAIAEEERPDVFTVRVGNIPPGEEVSVWLTLAGPLPFLDGQATFRFPLVVAPRYIPGVPLPGPQAGSGTSADTDAVPDASRISPPVLLPGYPNPVQLSLAVEIDPAGLALLGVESSLHAVTADASAPGLRRLRILPGERLDRDFVLRLRFARERLGAAFALQPDATGQGAGTFSLWLLPPESAALGRRPRDVVVVLDRSGSMEGWKMLSARRAAARIVDSLGASDRFAVLAFDDRVETPPGQQGLQAASDRRRFQAVEFLAKLDARGGTEMAEPLSQAVDLLTERSGRDEGAPRERVVVLVTDGQIGNEDQLLRALGPRAAELRVFTLGIDQGVNAGFLNRLAGMSRNGASELVESEDRLDEVMESIHRRIDAPVLTGLTLALDGCELEPESLVPARAPDLFPGQPVLLTGRYRGARGRPSARVTARQGDHSRYEESLRGELVPSGGPLDKVWARGQLRQLEDRYVLSGGAARQQLQERIVATSLQHHVLCRFTAFVAVDRAEVVNAGGHVHAVTQPVEQPAGWAQAPGAASISAAGPVPCMPAAMPAPRGGYAGRAAKQAFFDDAGDSGRMAEACRDEAEMDFEVGGGDPFEPMASGLSQGPGAPAKDSRKRSAPRQPAKPKAQAPDPRRQLQDLLWLLGTLMIPTKGAAQPLLAALRLLVAALRAAAQVAPELLRPVEEDLSRLEGCSEPELVEVLEDLREHLEAIEAAWDKPARREGFWL